jgi:pyridoxal phosphate enzyme (YggS family)
VTRKTEIELGLAQVRDRIARACSASARPDDVTLVVVTKTYPASDVRILTDLGVRDVGENRHQEAASKFAECADLELTWHMIGQLQRNKAAGVVQWADVIETIDRPTLADAVGRSAVTHGVERDVLLQVNLDQPARPERGGCAPDDVPALCAHAVGVAGLRVRGVMGVAPYPGDPEEAFARLARIAGAVREVVPGATVLSAGMSDDLEAAIAHGATHVRVGSAVLGRRPTLQ